MRKLSYLVAAVVVAVSAGGFVAANGPKPAEPAPEEEKKPADGKPGAEGKGADGKPGDRNPDAKDGAPKKAERPGLDAAKVPGVPVANGGLMCANPGTLSAVGRMFFALKSRDLKTEDVAAVPFTFDGSKKVEKIAELDAMFEMVRLNKAKPGEASWVIADMRVVPKGSSRADAEAWLGMDLGRNKKHLAFWEFAEAQKAELAVVFTVKQRPARKADDKPTNAGEVILVAVKDSESAVKATVIGFVD